MEKEMRLHMRLRKTLFAMVAVIAVASMVLPSVRASVTITARHRQKMSDPNAVLAHQDLIRRHNSAAYSKRLSDHGKMKPEVNNGLIQDQAQLFKNQALSPTWQPLDIDNAVFQQHMIGNHNKTSKLSSAMVQHVMNMGKPETAPKLTQAQLDRLQIRLNHPTETAAQRRDRLAKAYASAKAGHAKVASGGVLPSRPVADDSAFSATGFVSLSSNAAASSFDSTFEFGDLDGGNKLERDFDQIAPTLVPRTAVDSSSPITQNILLPGEVYTDVAVSGHNAANGWGDYNVFYTGTNFGFITAEKDTVGDGDLLSDAPPNVIALTDLGFSPSASVTGLAVEEDAEYDGDAASDEILWFTAFDPQFGRPGTVVSVRGAVIDTD
jgi:hypothetical protein